MLHVFIFILAILVVWHIVWEAVLAPGGRLVLRYRLFALRDDLRKSMESVKSKRDMVYYVRLNDGINRAINELGAVDIIAMRKYYVEYKNDPVLRAKLDSYCREMDAIDDPVLQQVRQETAKIIYFCMGFNSGGWLLYLVPLILLAWLWERSVNIIKIKLSTPSNLWSRGHQPA